MNFVTFTIEKMSTKFTGAERLHNYVSLLSKRQVQHYYVSVCVLCFIKNVQITVVTNRAIISL